MTRLPLKPALLLLFLILSAACDRSPDPKTTPPPRTGITFLHYFTDSLSGGIAETAKSFNRRSSRYDLNPIPLDHESFETGIRPNLESGHPPDLYSYWAGARTASLIDQLEPIDDIWRSNKLDERFSPTVIKAACEYEGKKYFIPLTQHYVGFFYNKKVFADSGITPPKSWDEFLVVCERLKARGIIPIALGTREKWTSQFWFDLLLLRTAPYEFRQKLMRGEVGYREPAVTEVFARWSQLVQKGYFNSRPNDLSWDSGANELVYSGKAAMTLMGTWIIGYFCDARHGWVAGRDFDFFPFPVMDQAIPLVSTGPIDGLIVPRKAVNKQGAKEAMLFLTEAEPQLIMSRGSGALAPSLLAPATSYSDIQQRVLREISLSRFFAFPYDLSTPPAVADLGIDAFTELLEFPEEYRKIQMRLAGDAAQQFSKIRGNAR